MAPLAHSVSGLVLILNIILSFSLTILMLVRRIPGVSSENPFASPLVNDVIQ